MLVIRKEQMEVFRAYMLEQFENRMLTHLRSAFPDQARDMPELDLRSLIHTGIENADKYGIVDEVDIRHYLEYMLIYGLDFDTNPSTSWAGIILRNPELTGTDKMAQIDDHDFFTRVGDQP